LLDSLLQENINLSRMSNSPGPALLRVKRLKTQQPSSMLVLSARKRKASDTFDDADKTDVGSDIKILKLAATLPVQQDGDKLTATVNKILKEKEKSTPSHSMQELKERYKKSVSAKNSPIHQVKENAKLARMEGRFKLVSQKRAINIEELEEWPEDHKDGKETVEDTTREGDSLYRLYDVVGEENDGDKKPADHDKVSCNGVEMIREYVTKQDDDYVYDLYYSGHDVQETEDFDDSLLDGLVSIQPFITGDDFLYDEYRDEFKYDDDEDSNDEDNVKNEYPDEDDEEDSSYFGYGEDDLDMDMRVKGLGLNSDEEKSDLSSDEEDQLLYTRAFDEDASRHGRAYAQFKQKMVREFYQDDSDEDDDCGEFADD